jgi:CheY-like chemotaxis protein/anti-sigma regulatory factor (Ser/Thr protein kinase)
MNTWNILVVDDDMLNRDIIAERLDDPHYCLEMAENGAEAWDKLHHGNQAFDLVLLDRMMPVMNGMELLHKIKGDPRFKNLAVIMQTAAATPRQIQEGLAAGCYYYLTKPYKASSLICIVNVALEELRSNNLLRSAVSALPALSGSQNAEFQFSTLEETHRLSALLASHCPDPAGAALGLSELLTNAIEHGNLGISYTEKSQLKRDNRWEEEIIARLQQPQYRDKKALVSFTQTSDKVVFTIIDQGNGFNWQKYLDFDPERAFDPNGRGIAMAGKLAFTRLEYCGKGNHVIATIKLNGG